MPSLDLAHELEAQARAMNAALSAVYQSLADIDWQRERDHFAEELALEERSYNHERY